MNTSTISDTPIPPYARLIVLAIFDIPSSVLTVFILFGIFRKKPLRQSLHNHVVIALLFSILPTQFFDIPFNIIYLSSGYVWPANSTFCLLWIFVSIGIFDTTCILMAYASIERYILILHQQWLASRRKEILFHYLPLIIVSLYSIIFYMYAILFPPCQTNFDYTAAWCSYPCYYDDETLSTYDTIANVVVPTCLVFLFNLLLLLRVHLRKRQFVPQNQWRKQRRMILQLFSLSLLLIVFDLPVAILILIDLSGFPSDESLVFSQYAYFFTYFIPLLFPFVCLASFPDIYRELFELCRFFWRRITRKHSARVQPRQ